jgi:hypothetical protein
VSRWRLGADWVGEPPHGNPRILSLTVRWSGRGRVVEVGDTRRHPQRETEQYCTHEGDRNKKEAHDECGRARTPQRSLKVPTNSGHGDDEPTEGTERHPRGHTTRHGDPSNHGMLRTHTLLPVRVSRTSRTLVPPDRFPPAWLRGPWVLTSRGVNESRLCQRVPGHGDGSELRLAPLT